MAIGGGKYVTTRLLEVALPVSIFLFLRGIGSRNLPDSFFADARFGLRGGRVDHSASGSWRKTSFEYGSTRDLLIVDGGRRECTLRGGEGDLCGRVWRDLDFTGEEEGDGDLKYFRSFARSGL